MDMKAKPKFDSSSGNIYLLLMFADGSVELYNKRTLFLDTYERWKNSSAIEIEELTAKEIKDRLTEANRDEKTEQLGKIFRQMLKLKNEFGE